jgi:hypothetical protein
MLAGTILFTPLVSGQEAMRRFRDPETGAKGGPSAVERGLSETAPQDGEQRPVMVEESVSAPAGGVKVNLRGAHRAAVTRRLPAAGAGTAHECTQD